MPVLKCACGQTEAKVTGEPFGMINCCCHCCVASAKFVADKNTAAKTNGTSGLTSDGTGNAIVLYKPNQLGEFTKKPEAGIGALQVGDKGSPHRFYAKCCNTYLTGAHSTFLGLNPNALYIEDGDKNSTKYNPTLAPTLGHIKGTANVPNVMRKFAFDPAAVPEPAFSIMPATVATLGQVSHMLNLFGPKLKPESGLTVQAGDPSIEVVPITWE
mmetsp:Transcript_20423/g.33830  ORF Transcript_20423/g.33830 Transcript_20423/m.33830 type:complete len:214 (+) Transcript_20423:165-806(+)|eukprot:CAMPEP_0119011324 /NCGR_PEP_ID=MMETSP1176-20130426/5596_1 /TAXON_ID=265551 /ORGANISM="Synedropsis recta cf, Strain CCMP1620" /LENGTH=213 /DNA_ID=CAMNT_0006964125 /DNA_START=143 /DNA_END=784 /DNA_ORIENTATION=-